MGTAFRVSLWALALSAIMVLVAAPDLPAVDPEERFPAVITDPEDGTKADVVLDAGVKKVAVLATTVVEQVFGQDPQATTWLHFGADLQSADGIGAAGDTVRIQIPAGVSPIGTVYPAVDVTYTIVAGDLSDPLPERAVALNVCAALEADSDFLAAEWNCTVARDFSLVHINSELFNEWGERTSWTLTCSGTTVCNQGFTDIARRGSPTELSRSPNDPRQGVLSIAGSVTSIPQAIGDKFSGYLENGGSNDMTVDGSVTPVVFEIMANPGANAKTILIEEFRCFMQGNGIKFGQYGSKSGGPLTNGSLVTLISDGETFTFEPITTTEDWKNLFATSPGTDFRVDVQSGADEMIAQYRPDVPFPLIKDSGDKVSISIRDNLSSGITTHACYVFGYETD